MVLREVVPPPGLLKRHLSTQEIFVQAVSMLAQTVYKNHNQTPNGQIVWSTSARLELTTRLAPPDRPVADGYWDLYSGNPGIAIFLAAHARLARVPRSLEICLQAIRPFRDEVRYTLNELRRASRLKTMPIGALVGTASLLYSLLKIGQLIGEPTLIEEAHALSSLITPERIEADQFSDFVFGSAGVILALLALDKSASGKNARGHTPLDLAYLCARQLLVEKSGRDDDVAAALKTPGISHGISGISMALLRLFRKTGHSRFYERARELLLSETVDTNPTWCHGSAGKALALTELLKAPLPRSERNKWSRVRLDALEVVASAPHSSRDHLCCGNMGRVAVLASVARQIRDPYFSAKAQELAVCVLRVAKTRGRFTYDYRDTFDSSFFRGAAGIGYTLMAMAYPGMLPSIIALE